MRREFFPSLRILVVAAALAVGVLTDQASAALLPVVSESGMIHLSVDGVGSNTGSGLVEVEKPSAGATVRRAALSCAKTGFVSGSIADGDILLDGTPITWSMATFNFGTVFHNVFADVTALVTSKINASAAGRINFTIEEVFTLNVDGCTLAVIFDDPSQTATRTAVLFFGGQEPAGDSFQIQFSSAININVQNFTLDFGLGISYGAQDQTGFAGSHVCGTESPMYSTIDVNGSRLTSCAGNSDDGVGLVDNGILFTVGGLDDFNNNPSDPNQQAADGQNPRVDDDELYSFIPFVMNGSSVISVLTSNASLDDNIFFAHLLISGQGDIFVETIFSDGFETGNTSRWSAITP